MSLFQFKPCKRPKSKTLHRFGRVSILAVAVLLSTLLTTPALVAQDSLAVQLEKAVYTEETVGNLDEAIQAYQRIVAEGNASAVVAAKAQYRIGICYEKQGKTTEAAAAFQTVIDKFPQATETVALAKTRLPGDPSLLPVPWGNGDEMLLEMTLPNGLTAGFQIFRVKKSKLDGRDVWDCSNWQNVTLNGQSSRSQVSADMKSFAPIKSHWRHSMLGEADATYGDGEIAIELAGKDETKKLEPESPVFDNEQAAQMFRRLPLKIGYKSKLRVVSTLVASEVPITVSVTEQKEIEVPAGKFDCFRVELNIGQTFWISSDKNRYIVRFEAGGISANLKSVKSDGVGEPTKVDTPTFSLTLPADWYAFTPSNSGESDRSYTWLADPNAWADTRTETGDLESIKAKHATPKAWLEHAIEEYRKRSTGLEMEPDGITQTKVDGHDAAVAVVEFVDGDKKMKAKRITMFGDSSAMNLRFMTTADHFDSIDKDVDQILNSLRLK